MARQLSIEFPGAVYHITSRGNVKQPVFLDDGEQIENAKMQDLTQRFRVCTQKRGQSKLCNYY